MRRLPLPAALVAALVLAGCGNGGGGVHGLHGSGVVSTKAEPGNDRLSASTPNAIVARTDIGTTITTTPGLGFAVTIVNTGEFRERDVKVTLTIQQRPSPILQAKTIDRIDPGQQRTVIFRNLGQVQLATLLTLKVDIAPVLGEKNLASNSERYPVIFTLD
jgi:hypothetical protein